MSRKTTLTERVAVVETKLDNQQADIIEIKDTLNKIRDNHLAHIDAKLEQISVACKKTPRHFSGKEKAAIIGAFLAASSPIIVEAIKCLLT
jgi:hypothetical protein